MAMNFPFAAIVGQDLLKKALLLCAVNPALGGVLIRGDKGSAKSTAARGLVEILVPIERVESCAFNCLPGEALAHCQACQAQDATPKLSPVPFVNLPLGATEDRVLGSIDFERVLKDGRKAFQPGLLASAHRGILYIDEVNLLPDHLVDVLLDVAAMGVNTVEREGLSINHPARITLIGTMNLEEGDLRPQLLDRFGMMVEVEAPRDPAVRGEVVRRRLDFDAHPEAFIRRWQPETQALQSRLLAAQTLLPQVVLSDPLFAFISRLCCEFEVTSLRADLVMNKAARALAALDGRVVVTAEDVQDAAKLVLPHRRRRKPFEKPGLDQEKLEQLMREGALLHANPEPLDAPETELPPATDEMPDGQGPSEQMFHASTPEQIRRIKVQTRTANDSSGRRATSIGTSRGRYMRAVPNEKPEQVAVDATLRHALLRNPNEFGITKADLHEKVMVGKNAILILMVVDASGSMAARKRMELVKASVLGLLEDAYLRRDHVAVIAFRGTQAELVLPPTRDVEQAEQALRDLPTGGRTPLSHALQLAVETLEQNARSEALTPLLVIMSDGKGNVTLDEGGDPWLQTLALSAQLAERGVSGLVLDTEQGFVRIGRAHDLAEALNAEYLPMEGLSAQGLTLMIRERLGK